MSTKTSIKRIAAVAAVALTLGGFTAVSAHAGTTPTIAATSGTNSTGGTAGTAPTATATVGAYVVDTVTAGTADSVYTITSSGVGQLSLAAAPATATNSTSGAITTADTNSQNYSINSPTSVTWYAGTYPGGHVFATGVLTFAATSTVAGTQTITVVGNAGGSVSQTITWGAAPVVSTTNTTVYTTTNTTAATVGAGSVATAQGAVSAVTSNSTLLLSKTATTTPVGSIVVTLKNSASSGGAAVAAKAVTATVTGAGLVDGYTSTGTAFNGTPSKSATAYTDSNGYAVFHVSGDGTSGVSTIAITYTDSAGVVTTLSTKTVTYYSSTVASLVVTQGLSVAAAGTTLGASDGAGDGAFIVAANDSAGNPITGLSAGTSSSTGFFITSDNTACISSSIGTVTEGTAAASYLPKGTYDVNVAGATNAVSGCSANVTVNYYNSSTSTITASAPLKFSVGGTKIYGLKLTASTASAAPGDKITYTLTATDSAGNAVADNYYGVFNANAALTAVSGLSLNASTPSTPFAKAAVTSGTTNLFFIGGVATSSTYAPYATGTVTASMTTSATSGDLAAAAQGLALTASFAVTNTSDTASQAAVDAANEATDAANAATDAANNAMDSADAAQQAALDAGDKADAALAAVTDLATKVSAIASQIAALSALVKKIAAKVKA